jgi:hypothetical protein
MFINQALCGEKNKSWALLQTTMSDKSLANKIAFRADLQDIPPSGNSWHPVVRGFQYNEFYLIIKTYPDNSPEVRTGRVFSHCLIINIDDFIHINNMKNLFSYFKNSIDKSILLKPIEFSEKNESKLSVRESLKSRFNKAIHGYANLENYNGTIIWVGQEDYEESVCNFWHLLNLEERKKLNIDIYFNIKSIPIDKINFITTPVITENKFLNSGFLVIRKNDSLIIKDFTEKYLAGDAQTINRLNKFINSIGAQSIDRVDIKTIAKGIHTFENINQVKDFKLLNTLSHIVAIYSPDEKKGTIFKKQLLDKICLLVKKADVIEILLVKSFKIESFSDSEQLLSQAMTRWIDDVLFSVDQNNKKDFTSIINQYYNATSSNWWVNLIGYKLKFFLSKIDSSRAKIIWLWLYKNFQLLKKFQLDLDTSNKAENHFIAQFPSKIKKTIFKELKLFTIKVHWLKLHAKILEYEHPFKIAITEQIKVDTDKDYDEAIKIIIEGVKPIRVIKFSVDNCDERLLNIAGELCHNDPNLLEIMDIEKINWQKIWFEALINGNTISSGIRDPQIIIFKIYDNLLNGKPIHEGLLDFISKTEYANLLHYPGREIIWSKVPSHLKNRFLDKTASVLLESISKDSTFEVPDDNFLLNYILSSNAISDFLYFNRNNIKNVLPIFNALCQIPEKYLKDYISNYGGAIDIIDATQLGKLVSDRKFGLVTNEINRKIRQNQSFKIALAECSHLLDFRTRSINYLTGNVSYISISIDEWWEAFAELVYKLYSGGPTHNKIWKQAGGEEYDLLTKGSGKEIWIDAMKKLRNGGCKGITSDKLLKKMSKEHSNNDEIKTLIKIKEKI